MTNEAWGQVREELIKRVGKHNYTTWIEPLKLSHLKNGVARFEVPTTFFGDWVLRNYGDHIRTQPFKAHCELPKMPGTGPLGGHVAAARRHERTSAAQRQRADTPTRRASGEVGA